MQDADDGAIIRTLHDMDVPYEVNASAFSTVNVGYWLWQ